MATNVQLQGSTVLKIGRDIPLNFYIFLGQEGLAGGSGYDLNANLTVDNLAQKFSDADIEIGTVNDFVDSLGLGWPGKSGPYSKLIYMRRGRNTDRTQKLSIGKANKLEKLAGLLEDNEAAKLTTSHGSFFDVKKSGDTLTYTFYLTVLGYSASNRPESPTTKDIDGGNGTVEGTTEGFTYTATVELCSQGEGGFFNCPDSEASLQAIGFSTQAPYQSNKKFKVSKTTLETDLKGKINQSDGSVDAGDLDVFFFLFSPSKEFCKFPLDRLCAKLVNVEKEKDDSLTALTKGDNFRTIEGASAGAGCGDLSCKADNKYKKPLYDALSKHLIAGGFSQIVPDSFRPVEMAYSSDPSNPDATEQYQFVGYQLAGRYVETKQLASEAVSLYSVNNRPVRFLSRLEDKKIKGRLDRPNGELDLVDANNLFFATSQEQLDKFYADDETEKENKKGKVFNETVSFNVIQESVYKMADIWRQTAQVTLNEQNVPYGRKRYKEEIATNLLSPGGQEEVIDAYVFGTELELEKQLFGVFKNHFVSAGYDLVAGKIGVALDLAYSDINAEQGQIQTATMNGSVSVANLLETIRNGAWSEEEVKSKILIDSGDFDVMEGTYDIHDITVRYTSMHFNNIKLDFGIDPFVSNEDGKEAWDTFNAAAQWEITDGVTSTLTARADGGLGLDVSWVIDPDDEKAYEQSNIRQKLSTLQGSILQSGFVYDPNTKLPVLSASMSKKLNEAIEATIDLTGANVRVNLSDKHGKNKDYFGKLDFSLQATFGFNYDLNPLNPNEESAEKQGNSSSEWALIRNLLDAEMNLSVKKNLFDLGNSLGNICAEVDINTSLQRPTGVIQGIQLITQGLVNIKYQNDMIYEMFGLPIIAEPKIGTGFAFGLHKVTSSYFGSEYSGYSFNIGLGLFGLDLELHSRKRVIQRIIKRKKYTNTIPLLGSVLGWAEYETDEDYIARAWPCLVYNFVNWAKEDFQNKDFESARDLKAKLIWPSDGDSDKGRPGFCEDLKGPLKDFFDDNYEQNQSGNFLDSDSKNFYSPVGADSNYLTWLKIDCSPGYPAKQEFGLSGLPPGGSAPFVDVTALNPDGTSKYRCGDWVSQDGTIVRETHADAVRRAHPSWSNWPNMNYESGWGYGWPTDKNVQAQFSASSTAAYLYYEREKSFGEYPCEMLFEDWKVEYVRQNQKQWVLQEVEKQLAISSGLLTNEINGITKEVSTTDSLFDQLFKLLRKSKPSFKLKEFIDQNPTIYNKNTNEFTAPLAGPNNGLGVNANQTWGDYNHKVTDDSGAEINMAMLTKGTIKKVLEDFGRDDNDRDPNSAIDNYYADPVFGLVKCYFTYMAPMGEHESMKLVNGEWVDNSAEYLKPYDPNIQAAKDKRLEIRRRNNKIANGQLLLDNNTTFNNRYEEDGQKIYYDKYGNTNLEWFKWYRPGWVYTKRETNSTGDIVWVVPIQDTLRKHQYYFEYGKEGKAKISKIGQSVQSVTDVCTGDGSSGGLTAIIKGLWNVITRIFGSKKYFSATYRMLPWLYTDADNAINAITTTNALMKIKDDRPRYMPTPNSYKDLPFPNTNYLSYQEAPWKGNNNSSYLDFYEFMAYVERDAKEYFMPDYLDTVAPAKVSLFCNTKTNVIKAFGILKGYYILEKDDDDLVTCKYCNSGCDSLPPSDGTASGAETKALGEIVGLKSMLGERHNPSTETSDIQLKSSLFFSLDVPWAEYLNNPGSYGEWVYHSDDSKGTNIMPEQRSSSFNSLRDKFKYIRDRVNAISGLITKGEKVFSNTTALTSRFTDDTVLVHPNYTDPNRTTYTYEAGESISNPQELAALQTTLEIYRDRESVVQVDDIGYNINHMLKTINVIAQEPKYVENNKEHKFSDLAISTSNNMIASINLGKGGIYKTTSDLAHKTNEMINLVKPIANELAAGGLLDRISPMLTKFNGKNLGLTDGSNLPVRKPDNNYIFNRNVSATQQLWLLQDTDSGNKIYQELFPSDALIAPNLSNEYIDFSVDLLRKVVPYFSDTQWIWDKAQFSQPIQNELDDKPYFYNSILSDLSSVQYLTSIALSGWTAIALDVLRKYWTGEISNWSDACWLLNRRLWPLISAMNQASRGIYHDTSTDGELHADLIREMSNFELTPTPDFISTNDFHMGVATSSSDGQMPADLNQIWSNDDVVFAHRNNVLRLLFPNILFNVNNIFNPSIRALNNSQVSSLLDKYLPCHNLAISFIQGLTGVRNLYENLPNGIGVSRGINAVNYDILNTFQTATTIMDSATYGIPFVPEGRDRFGNDTSFICQVDPVTENFTTRKIGDGQSYNLTAHVVSSSFPKFLQSQNFVDQNYSFYQATNSWPNPIQVKSPDAATNKQYWSDHLLIGGNFNV